MTLLLECVLVLLIFTEQLKSTNIEYIDSIILANILAEINNGNNFYDLVEPKFKKLFPDL
jgi:hypothetical protein